MKESCVLTLNAGYGHTFLNMVINSWMKRTISEKKCRDISSGYMEVMLFNDRSCINWACQGLTSKDEGASAGIQVTLFTFAIHSRFKVQWTKEHYDRKNKLYSWTIFDLIPNCLTNWNFFKFYCLKTHVWEASAVFTLRPARHRSRGQAGGGAKQLNRI